MTPKALIFDVFGTLVDWRGSIAREVAAVLPDVDATAFADAWREEYDPAMAPIRDGTRDYVPLDTLHRENLDRILPRFGQADLPDETRQNLTRGWHRLDPWPDTVTGLTALKRHAIIAPCSNGSIALMTRLARHGGLPWDCILGADIARSYKPHPQTYLASAAALDLAAHEVMMVAAHNADLAAAHALGLATAFVPRPDEFGPDGRAERTATGPWTTTAPDLPSLAKQLF